MGKDRENNHHGKFILRYNFRGQVAIFIIIAIFIVLLIFIFFLLSGNEGEEIGSGNLGPKDFITACVGDVVKDSVDEVMKNGGEVSPWQTILYNNEEWTYLCYQADYYLSCYNLYPMLGVHAEEEIVKISATGIISCFNEMKKEFEGRGYEVSGSDTDYSVNLIHGNIVVNIEKNIKISDRDGSKNFNDFSFEVISPLYDLIRVSREIVNSESQFCNFEYNGYMLLYPEYDIRRIDYMGSKMYRVIDRRSGDEFKFAVRSCAFAPGI